MPKPLILVLMIALPGAAVFAPITMAQMRAPSLTMPGAVAPSGFGRSVGISFAGRPHSHSFDRGAIFLGDPFYADYRVEPLAAPTAPPQVIIVQPATADTPPETKSEPLMIELRGNRYVRFGGRQQSAERGMSAAPDYAEAEAANSSRVAQPPAQPELSPTVLIFRDGHREQVPEYAIVGSILYASADYWQSGHWTKNIQLSALNIPATVRANHDNGVKFILPSAPNEVVVGP
ncbi:MAG TPA: hypothetical protein VN948_07885 [Terriglobales bacterium]|nr:hypothetical protein [Terriglobales bacterium]